MDTDLIQTGLVAVGEGQAWYDAQHAGLVAQLREVDSYPEQAVAKAAKQVLGDGGTLQVVLVGADRRHPHAADGGSVDR